MLSPGLFVNVALFFGIDPEGLGCPPPRLPKKKKKKTAAQVNTGHVERPPVALDPVAGDELSGKGDHVCSGTDSNDSVARIGGPIPGRAAAVDPALVVPP